MAEWPRPLRLGLPTRVGVIMVLVCLATMVCGSVAMYHALSMDDEEMLDGRLVALSAVVLNFAKQEASLIEATGGPHGIHVESDATFGALYRYQIWSRSGQLLLRTTKAPASAPFGPLAAQGFRNVTLGGEQLRVLTMPSVDGGMILQMAESIDEREMNTALVSRRFLMFVGLPLLLIGSLAYQQTRRALAGLTELTTQVQQRGVSNLSPIDGARVPSELGEMLGAINSVFERVDSGVRAEQEFASMAAHELRSPLAGLRAQAQLALHLDDAREIRAALHAILGATDQAARVIDQLLDLARFEVLSLPTATPSLAQVDLDDVVSEALEDLERLRRRSGVVIESRLSGSKVHGHRGGLVTIVRNLVNNALRYTPSGGKVLVSVAPDGDAVRLVIEDSGPGIPAGERPSALQRFNRLGRADGEGAGLGLAIVQSVVRFHQATLELSDSSLGGLRVDVRLRTAPPEPRAEAPAKPLPVTGAFSVSKPFAAGSSEPL